MERLRRVLSMHTKEKVEGHDRPSTKLLSPSIYTFANQITNSPPQFILDDRYYTILHICLTPVWECNFPSDPESFFDFLGDAIPSRIFPVVVIPLRYMI